MKTPSGYVSFEAIASRMITHLESCSIHRKGYRYQCDCHWELHPNNRGLERK